MEEIGEATKKSNNPRKVKQKMGRRDRRLKLAFHWDSISGYEKSILLITLRSARSTALDGLLLPDRPVRPARTFRLWLVSRGLRFFCCLPILRLLSLDARLPFGHRRCKSCCFFRNPKGEVLYPVSGIKVTSFCSSVSGSQSSQKKT